MVTALTYAQRVEVEALGPAPAFRSGRIDQILPAPAADGVVFRSTSPRGHDANLFFTRIGAETAAPIRLNHPGSDGVGVSEGALMSDDTTVVYAVPDPGFDRAKLFANNLNTGAARRLDAASPDAPGTAYSFGFSPGGTWVIISALSDDVSTSRHFAVRPNDTAESLELSHPVLFGDGREVVFSADDEHAILVDNTTTPASLWRYHMQDGELSPLDTTPADQGWRYMSGRSDSATGLVVAELTRQQPHDFATRFRLIDPASSISARWLTDSFRSVHGSARLSAPSRWLVVGQETTASPTVAHIHNLTDETRLTRTFPSAPSLRFDNQVTGPGGATITPGLDRMRELLFYAAGFDRRVLRLSDGADVSLHTLVEAADLPPPTTANPFAVLLDETGRAHLFVNTADQTWWLDPAPDSVAPARLIAPFVATASAVHSTRGHVILQTPSEPADAGVRELHLASLTGMEPRPLGRQSVQWFDPAPAFFTPLGERLIFPQPEVGLVVADLDASAHHPERISPEWALVSSAAFLSVSPTRAHVVVSVDNTSVHLAPLEGGPWRKIADGDFAFWNVTWTPDGRWMLLSDDATDTLRAINTRDEHPERILVSSFHERIVGLGYNQTTIHARIGLDLSFYETDLTSGATRELGQIPASPGAWNNAYPNFGYVSPEFDAFSLVVQHLGESAVWLVPLVGDGSPIRLVGSTEIGPGIAVLGVDAGHVYVSTYENAVHAVPRDGTSRIRLTEAPPSGAPLVGATDVRIDLGRRFLAYASTYPDGVRRLHRRSLDEPAESGFAAEVFEIEGWRPLLRGGAILSKDGADAWYVPPRGGGDPMRLSEYDGGSFTEEFDLSADGRIAFVSARESGLLVLRRFDTTTGEVTLLSPPHISPGALVAGPDDREVWFVGIPAATSTQRVYRGRLLPAVVSPDGLDHPDYAAWVVASELPVGLEAAEEDADGDGVPNLLEYIFGGDALDAEDAPSAGIRIIPGDDDSFEINFSPPSRLSRAHLESSSDLRAWFNLPEIAPRLVGPTSTSELEWRVPLTHGTRIFYRMRFELP